MGHLQIDIDNIIKAAFVHLQQKAVPGDAGTVDCYAGGVCEVGPHLRHQTAHISSLADVLHKTLVIPYTNLT